MRRRNYSELIRSTMISALALTGVASGSALAQDGPTNDTPSPAQGTHFVSKQEVIEALTPTKEEVHRLVTSGQDGASRCNPGASQPNQQVAYAAGTTRGLGCSLTLKP